MDHFDGTAPAGKIAYEILVQGHLNGSWSRWFDEMTVEDVQGFDSPLTKLSGALSDQAALRGVLNKIWDLNLCLVAVHPQGWEVARKGV